MVTPRGDYNTGKMNTKLNNLRSLDPMPLPVNNHDDAFPDNCQSELLLYRGNSISVPVAVAAEVAA